MTKSARRAAAACRGLTAAALLAAALLAGCSPRSQPLAQVGSETITVGDFTAIAQRVRTLYTGSPDSAKKQLLDELVKRSLLLQAARREPSLSDSAVRHYRQNLESQILSTELMQRLVPRSVPVAEAEVRELYARRNRESHMQVICTPTERLADAALAEVRGGADFTAVAGRFNITGLVPTDGDLGFRAPGALPSTLDAYLDQAPLGKVMGPIHPIEEAWFIVRVTERRPRTQEPYEQQQPMLAEVLRQRKRRALSRRAFQHLREAYHLRVEPGGPQLLLARFATPPEGAAPETRDPSRVLARFDGGGGRDTTYRLADALADLESGTGDRPDPSMLSTFERWIESSAMQRIVLIEARRRRLHQEPDVAREIRRRTEDYLLDSILGVQVVARAHATDADVQAAYQREAPTFARLESAELQHLTVPDSASGERILQQVRGSRTLRGAILLASPGLQLTDEVVRFPTRDSAWASLAPMLVRMATGAYGGPVRVGGGWRVIQLISARRFYPPFESLSQETQQMLRVEAENLARERRLAEFTDSLRRTVRVIIDERRLKRMPWPATPGGPAG
jgi:hypothetical protein